MKAIVMTGGPEVIEYVECPDSVPGTGQVLVEIAIAGVNFMDVGVRHGMAWREMPDPKVLGVEGVGRILAVGDRVEQNGIPPLISGTHYVPLENRNVTGRCRFQSCQHSCKNWKVTLASDRPSLR